MPLTVNGPPAGPDTTPPVGGEPSPQLMVAVKSAVVAPGLASLKDPTVPEKADPSVAVTVTGAPGVRAASATVAVPVAVAGLVALSVPCMTTVVVKVPSSA